LVGFVSTAWLCHEHNMSAGTIFWRKKWPNKAWYVLNVWLPPFELGMKLAWTQKLSVPTTQAQPSGWVGLRPTNQAWARADLCEEPSALTMEVTSTSEISVIFYQTTQHEHPRRQSSSYSSP
jgi:hypothetical protein